MARTVFIRKLKRPDGSGVWPAYVFDANAVGTWLFSPKGSLYRGEKSGVTGICEVGQGSRDEGLPVLHLIPAAGWWVASWAGEGTYPQVSVDICTPPSLVGHTWTYVDLELDVLSHQPGVVRIDDEDEFAAASQAGIITTGEATAARAATDEVARLLRCGAEPFGRQGPGMLAKAITADLLPLRNLPQS